MSTRSDSAIRCDEAMAGSYGIKIVQENVSVTPRVPTTIRTSSYAEDIIPFNSDRDIDRGLADSGL